MAIFKDEVVVIKAINYGEADKILTVLGKNLGKFPLLAKGIRKIESKNRGNMQTLSVSSVSFYRNKGMGVLTESKNVFTPEYDNSNIKGIERVLFLLNRFLEEDCGRCDFYEKLFYVLQSGFKDDDVNKFRLIFLKKMGLIPYRNCKVCGCVDGIGYVDLNSFELFCGNCSSDELKKIEDIDYLSASFSKKIDDYILKVLD